MNEEVPEEAGAQEVDEENGDTEAELLEEDLDEEEVATEDEDGVDLKDKTVRVIRKDGKLIKKVIGIKGQGKTKVIEYNSKGKPRKITNYNEEGSIQSITKNQYKNGQIAKSVTKDASGAITRETFTKKGAVIKEVFNAEKNLVSLTKTTKSGEQRILEETTTARGKMITERTEDGQITRRKLVNPKNGKTIRVAKYDENGNAVAVKTYDKKGNLKSETSKKYTADGSLKKSKQVNSDGSKKIIRKSQAPREDGSVKFKTKVNKTSGDQKSSKSNGNPWPTAMSAAKTGAPTTQGPVAAPLKRIKEE